MEVWLIALNVLKTIPRLHIKSFTHTAHINQGDREADMGITTVRQITTTQVWEDRPKESDFHRLGDGSSPQQTDRQLEVLIFIKS